MKKLYLFALPILGLCLTSCGQSNPALTDYVKSLDLFAHQDSVKVLQLTDIHWSVGTDFKREDAYLTALVVKANPDVIMITGDSFLIANQTTVNHLWSLVDSWKVPWAFTYGNHDEQGTYNPDYVSQVALSHSLDKGGYCIYSEVGNDNVYGNSNFVINLTAGSKTVWQLYGLDSNSLHFNGLYNDYDVIHQDQIDWYEKEVKAAQSINQGSVVPSLAFFHIPLWQTAYCERLMHQESAPGKLLFCGGDLRESVYAHASSAISGTRTYPGYMDSGFFKKAEQLGSTKGMFYGHDHRDDFYAYYHDDDWDEARQGIDLGILLAYGLKSGAGLYADADMLGGNVLTIHKDGSFDPHPGADFNPLFFTYAEAGL